MTVKTNYLAGHSYDPADLIAQFAGLFSDGVLEGGAVTEHSPANLSVDVAAVKALCAGLFCNSTAVANVAITSNTSGYGRIDIIAVDLDNESIISVMGTPSSSPTAPVLTGNKIALAQVAVGNNVSVINTANITSSTAATSRSVKVSGSLIMKIVPLTIANGTGTLHNFDVAFPNGCLGVWPTMSDKAKMSIWGVTKTGFYAEHDFGSSVICKFLAIGY